MKEFVSRVFGRIAKAAFGHETEADVARDAHQVSGRPTGDDRGGQPVGDSPATTGTTRGDTYVGRVAGEDSGAAEESGAEVRARGDHDSPPQAADGEVDTR